LLGWRWGASPTCANATARLTEDYSSIVGSADDLGPDGDVECNGTDRCPTDPNKIEPGVCGCGVNDNADTDGDGVPDCIDQCPGVDDRIFAPGCTDAIPTTSEWGLIVLALSMLIVAKIRFGRRRQAQT
jgi:hypothetical protein